MCGATIYSCFKALGLSLSKLLQQFVWIALLQGRPQDMPAGHLAMRVAMIANVITYVAAVASTRSLVDSFVLALTDLAVSGLCLFAAVAVVSKTERFQQAFTAMAGGTAILNLVAIPVLWLSAASGTPLMGLVVFVFIVVWGLAIISHILRHTLEVSTLTSVGLAFGFYLVVLNLIAVTGVTGNPEEGNKLDLQTSIYQYVSDDWLSWA